jgi:pimeloyl-ACP methyl ester carboxylesterase
MRTDFRTAAGRGAFALAVILAVAILSSLSHVVPLPAQDPIGVLNPATSQTVRPDYSAPDGRSAADTTDCPSILAFTIGWVERNYPGFQDKVGAAERPAYAAMVGRLQPRAAAAREPAACHTVLAEYIAWFQDHHLGVAVDAPPPSAAAAIREPAEPGEAAYAVSDWPTRAVTEESVRGELLRRGAWSPVEGIWEVVGADYRLAVVPAEASPRGPRYDAVILRAGMSGWSPGEVKARLEETSPGRFEVEYFMGNRTSRSTTAELRRGLLLLDGLSRWARMHPGDEAGYDPARFRADTGAETSVRRLDDRTMLIRLPSFGPAHATKIAELVRERWADLTSTPDLIIDVRGNHGGTDVSFYPLRPLFYTRPLVTEGLSIFATADHIAYGENLVEEAPPAYRAHLEEMVARMREFAGGFVTAAADTFRLEGPLPMPRRVAVLTDRGCASSCEAFVLAARQSDKVTLYGDNTGGLTDYGNVIPVATPHPAIRLYVPTARSNRLPEESYDVVGIPPDVRLPSEVLFPLEWVQEQLRDGPRAGGGLPPSASTGQVDVDNGRLHYERQGDGPVVVLIHGGTMDLGIWDDMLAELVPYFRVIRYDLRGFGRSSRPTGHFAAYRDLAALLDALEVWHAKLVGLSAGARIALDFALEYPDRVDRLVLVAPTVSGYRGGPFDAPWAQELIAAIQQGDTLGAADAWLSSPAMRPAMERPELARRVRILTHANSGIFAAGPNPEVPLDPPALTRLEDVRAPTLVIVGDRDGDDFLAMADTLERRVPGAVKVVLAGLGHLPNLEDPASFNTVVTEFLRGRVR